MICDTVRRVGAITSREVINTSHILTTGGISVLIDMNLAHNVFFASVQEYATKSIVELRKVPLFSVVTQVVAIPYRRFGTPYKSHFQEWVFFVS